MRQSSISNIGSDYALDNDSPTAVRILDCLSKVLDDNSMFHLDEAMSRTERKQRFLELGAGNGSMAVWLAHHMAGDGGEVIAVDIKPQHVQVMPGVTVVGLDIAREDLPDGPFDLIHARLLLAHLPQRRDILRRCVDRLAPGGALVIEEWGSVGPSRILSDQGGLTADLYRRYTDALMQVFAARGNDPTWCVSVPAAMLAAGLTGVKVTSHARSWSAGTAGCELAIAVSTELHDQLVSAGIHGEDLLRLRGRLADPSTLLVGNLTWTTTGHKPA